MWVWGGLVTEMCVCVGVGGLVAEMCVGVCVCVGVRG